MDLTEWMHLSPDERIDIRKTWAQNWNEWAYLLDEAVESFKRTYGHIKEISRVSCRYSCELVDHSFVSKLTSEPCISVTTSLKSDQCIQEVPKEHAHFKVVQDPFGDIGEAYLKEWIALLKNLLGWTEEQTAAWAAEYHADDLRGKNSLFDHEWPLFYITDLLVPESKLPSWADNRRRRLLTKINRAIYGQNIEPLDTDYNWTAARNRVNNVLREAGLSLPE